MTRARDLGDFIADGAAAELVVDTTTLVVDSTNNRVGIGTASPSQALEVTGTAKLATVDIDAGAIDGAVIGANSAAAGTFTTATVATADINGGAIDGAIIGANSAAAVTATTLNASTKLQVNSTDVITNARQLSNIASIDATTAAAITAGGVGGGGAADFVASGAISNGNVVVLNANGTVSTVTSVSEGVGTTSAWGPSGSSYMEHISATFDSANNKVIVAYRDQLNNGYATAVVGTVSGSTISFGTPVVAYSGNSYYIAVSFIGGSHNKIVVAFRDADNSSYGRAGVGQVSGTSITFGSITTFENSTTNHVVSTFESNSNKLVLVYTNSGDSSKGKVAIGTINGTFNSISFGTPVTFHSGETYGTNSVTFDSNSNKIVIVYNDNNNTRTASIVGTVSGTSASFGSAVEVDSAQSDGMSLCFDSTNNKVVVAYKAGTGDAGGAGKARVGTVSGTAISWGATATFYSTAIGIWANALTYDASQQKVLVIYSDRASPLKGRASVGTVSGTSITFSSSVVAQDKQVYWPFAVYDSNATKSVLGWSYTPSNNNYATAAGVYTYPSTNAGSYLGVAAAAISDSATGSITINGGINEGQSSLSIGTVYYVADNGTLQTTNNGRKIGKAIATTKILVNSNMSGDEMNAYLGGLV
tara:strand:- start:1404 stop:3344 length:1941 start_codon:yes stop_codon:yes gene_type:complete